MAWIQLDQSLKTDKRTLKLQRLLSISSTYAMGVVSALWLWALDQAPDGDISDIEGDDIAVICDYPANADDSLLNALISSGFILACDSKRIIDGWDELTGRLMAKREIKKEKDRERQRAYRQRKKDTEEECHTDVTTLSQKCHTDVTPCHTPIQYSNSTVINNSGDDNYCAHACVREEPVENVENVENYGNDVAAEFKITYLKPDQREEVEKIIRDRASYYWKRDLTDYELRLIAEDLLLHHGGHVKDFIGLTNDDEFLLTEAFKSSVINDCKKVSYIEGVYRNFRQRNIYSSIDYYSYADRNLRLVCSG